jgi:hypothetical protein
MGLHRQVSSGPSVLPRFGRPSVRCLVCAVQAFRPCRRETSVMTSHDS